MRKFLFICTWNYVAEKIKERYSKSKGFVRRTRLQSSFCDNMKKKNNNIISTATKQKTPAAIEYMNFGDWILENILPLFFLEPAVCFKNIIIPGPDQPDLVYSRPLNFNARVALEKSSKIAEEEPGWNILFFSYYPTSQCVAGTYLQS